MVKPGILSMLRLMRVAIVACLLAAFIAGCGGRRGDRAAVEGATTQAALRIVCMSGASATALQELARTYPTSTCVRVEVVQVPRADFHDQIALQFKGRATDFDMVMGQCHWLAGFVKDQAYLDLSSLLKRDIGVHNVHPRIRRALCESPKGSGAYYAAPCYADPMGLVYRKDWFEAPEEKEAFKKRYGRDLRPPATWQELRDVAEFFQRPAEKRYGLIMLTGRDFNGLAYSFQQMFQSMGGVFCDGDNCRVAGLLNSDKALETVQLLKQFSRSGPPDCADADENTVNSLFVEGRTAVAINYFSSFPGMLSALGDKLGFAPVPAGRDGKRVCLLEGYGLSISAKISAAHCDMAQEFLKWFMSPETQKAWSARMPLAVDVNTLSNITGTASAPYMTAYRDSLDSLEGFWDLPVQVALMRSIQKNVGDILDDYVEDKKALDNLVTECETILREAYLLKEW